MKAFIITVVGIVIGLAASLANIMWLAVLAALIALAGAYLQYRDATAFEFIFLPTAWQRIGAEFSLVIPKKLHGKSNPTVTVFEGRKPNFQEVMVDIRTSSENAVVVAATSTFEGKVIIK